MFTALPHNSSKLNRYYLRPLLMVAMLLSGSLFGISPLLAVSAPPGDITNQATGSFVDEVDNSETLILSNTVKVTVAEVAGINVGVASIADAPSGVTNAGSFQSFAGVHNGDIVYFDFNIINVGNDPTQFFVPSTATINGGSLDSTGIRIIAYSDGSTTTNFDGQSGRPSEVFVPSGGGNTGGAGGLLTSLAVANNGSIIPNASIRVRVPVKITATAGNTVTVLLGDTPENSASTSTPKTRLQNQSVTTPTSSEVYTVDNSNPGANPTPPDSTKETIGAPLNGIVEASAIASTTVLADPGLSISGTIFEDINYGGGSGRANTSNSDTPEIAGVLVELYDSNGNFLNKTATTDVMGKYTFNAVVAGTYYVRAVTNTIQSQRTGGSTCGPTSGVTDKCLPVQTYRTDGIDDTQAPLAVTNKVGGEVPSGVDQGVVSAGAKFDTTNFTFTIGGTNKAQSVAKFKVGTAAVTGLDFGFNFDTIVNTNNTGQGSLRQFVTNSNSLDNTGLQQVGKPIGQEVSIFMIPDGTARPGLSSTYSSGLNGSGGNSNTAVIALSSQLVITDSNTSIDGRTQTQNVADTNSGTIGTGGTVGTAGVTLNPIPKPEIVLDFSTIPLVNGGSGTGGGSNPIVIQGSNTTLAGFAYYGYKIQNGLSGLNKGMVWVKDTVPDAGKAILTQLLGGTLADGSTPPANNYVGYGFQTSGAANISNNYFAYLAGAGNFVNTNGTTVNFSNNENAFNGPKTTSTTDPSGVYADQLETESNTTKINIVGNLIRNATSVTHASSEGKGLQINVGSSVLVQNNTFIANYQSGVMSTGIDDTIEKNIITDTRVDGAGNYGSAIVIRKYNATSGLRNQISQNSIYNNAKLGIDLLRYTGSAFVEGVNGNDGITQVANTGVQAANLGMDYPIVTSSTLTSGTLHVQGYVGNIATGSTVPAFVTAKLEFFIADNTPANQNGEIILGDGKSLAHGEGKTYIGTCNSYSNSLFDCSFTNAGTLGLSSAYNITATATDAVGNTSEFSAAVASDPNVLLVKRITAINGLPTKRNGDSLSGYEDSPSPYDDNVITIPAQANKTDPPRDTTSWPDLSNFLKGAIDGGTIKPDDSIEYTIYFLSTGEAPAKSVLFCDRVPNNVTFIQSAFNNITPNPNTLYGADRGIAINLGGTMNSYSNIADGDFAQYFPPGSEPSSVFPKISCGGANTNGAVVVNLGELPNATDPATPNNYYGFVRFQGRVK